MNNWGDKLLGFGLMRLPKEGEEISIPRVCEMVDAFMEKGFTYFDTAYVYPGSEVVFREAVAKRYPRESYLVADKMAGWCFEESGITPEEMFQEQLERCGIEYFDFYLLHSIQPSRVADYEDNNCWEFCRQKKAEGKIRHFGFSFHGDPELLERLLTEHPEVDFVQLQINYADWDDNAIYAGGNYEVCRKHEKDIVVMEPVKGGILANLRPDLAEVFRQLNPVASTASYALRFVGSLPGIKMILSGMSDEAQMQDNLATFMDFVPLTEEEKQAVATVKAGLQVKDTVPCTNCRYCCEGCPQEINIPEIFKCYNMLQNFGEHNRPHFHYDEMVKIGSGKAGDCIGGGQCETACPQHIQIIDYLKKASELLD